MGAPYGNQNALGSTTSGRPLEYDLEKEAQDLIEWSKREDAITLYDFTDSKEYLAQQLSQFANQNVVFSLALKKAKERIARKRERLAASEKMHFGVWKTSYRLYDKLTAQQEDEDADKEALRRAEANRDALLSLKTPQDQLEKAALNGELTQKDGSC